MKELTHDTPLGEIQSRLIELETKGVNPQFVMAAEGKWRVFDQDTGRTIAEGEL